MLQFQPSPFRNDQLAGWEGVSMLAEQREFSFKAILNENGVLFFPITAQHRDVKAPGLSYEDDYRGNALAVVFSGAYADIRYHRDFSDERAANLAARFASTPALSGFAGLLEWRYQGRTIRSRDSGLSSAYR